MAAIGAGAVLVGGGIGFNLVDALVDHGDEVTVTDDASTGRRENLARARRARRARSAYDLGARRDVSGRSEGRRR